jgi:hypothetical protein
MARLALMLFEAWRVTMEAAVKAPKGHDGKKAQLSDTVFRMVVLGYGWVNVCAFGLYVFWRGRRGPCHRDQFYGSSIFIELRTYLAQTVLDWSFMRDAISCDIISGHSDESVLGKEAGNPTGSQG